jgi:hypothetical protein
MEKSQTAGWWRRHSSSPHSISTELIILVHLYDIMDQYLSFGFGTPPPTAAK